LPVNFNSPYKATNVGDFWKRWHISLSSWLKDYLYIPMGGNKKATLFTYISLFVIMFFIVIISKWEMLAFVFAGATAVIGTLAVFISKFRNWIHTNINIMVTMLLGGLWHGASWMFVIWGGLNGLGIVIYKLWRKISPWEGKKNIAVRFWTIFITFNFITFTRIFFRGENLDIAKKIITKITTDFNMQLVPEITLAFSNVFIVMLIGYIIHWLPGNVKELYRGTFIKLKIWAQAIVVIIVIFILYQFHTSDLQAFIYFQF
jgi:D-alanyl-lipoteichoic acid acyltransferase DltB (MBOAT superfamily)